MARRGARKLLNRILLQRRTLDGNGDPLGPWGAVPSEADDSAWAAQVVWLKGGETVMAQRLQGVQPVVIVLRACTTSRAVDNAWRGVDVRDRQVYEFSGATLTEDRMWVEVLGVAKVGDLAELES